MAIKKCTKKVKKKCTKEAREKSVFEKIEAIRVVKKEIFQPGNASVRVVLPNARITRKPSVSAAGNQPVCGVADAFSNKVLES